MAGTVPIRHGRRVGRGFERGSAMVTQHFVHFLSPGTFTSEETRKSIDCWSPEQAAIMANSIRERHGAKPYGFQFSTRSRDGSELDSHETARSGMYFLGGTILTLDEVRNRKDPADRILIANMEANRWDRVIETNKSWKITLPFRNEDTLLDP